MTRELLIGAGSKHVKYLATPAGADWHNVTTLDNNADHDPDIMWDLTSLPLPFDDDSFDEIHAYEVLEHTGAQGDYRFFFGQFYEFWRILKPGGLLCGSVPSPDSVWAWGDPSHTRLVTVEQFTFLDQTEYTRQVGVTDMSDFRYLWHGDFAGEAVQTSGHSLYFVLRAVKPARR